MTTKSLDTMKPGGAVRIASWNINSVRARLHLVEQLMAEESPDILCFQETKVEDGTFPLDWFSERGFPHAALKGQKGHHGVAILSRAELTNIKSHDWCKKGDARHISAEIISANGRKVVLHNFYVPAGGDVPDPEINDKFAHKLRFLDEMAAWSKALDGPAILVGDLNVAPGEWDVWSHKQLLRIVSHTPPETERLQTVVSAHGWVDAVRTEIPEPEPVYTWWSYRAREWRTSNKGRRLDHVWLSPGLEKNVSGLRILKDARDWQRASDHVPIIFNLKI